MNRTSGVQVGRTLLLLTSCLMLSQSLFAATSGSAQGYGLHAQVSLGSLSPIDVPYAPNPPVTVTQTGSKSDQALNLALGIDAGLLGKPVAISTGVVKGNSQASLQGYATDRVSATGEVDNANIAVSAILPVLGITADVLQSTAQATCSAGTPALSGNSVITNLKVNVLGLPVSVPVSAGPNTSLSVPLLGLSVVLNEQIAQADQLTVNALHVSLSNYLLSAVLGTLNLDIALGSASASLQSACVPAPVLTLSKIADAVFVRGSNGSYTFVVTNSGGATAQAGLTLTDVLPAGLGYVSASGSGWTCTPSGQTVICTNPTTALAAGATSSLQMVVSVSAATPNPVANTAVVGNPDQPPPSDCSGATPPNGCATTTTTVQPTPLPVLILGKTAVGSFVRGSVGTYNFTVTNTGLGTAAGPVVMTDTLPAGMGYSGVSGNGWTCLVAGQGVTCSNPAGLAPLASSSFALAVTIAANTSPLVVNTASVGAGNDPAPVCAVGAIAIGCATATTPVTDPPTQNLQLSLSSSPLFIRAGADNLYTYTVTNTGNIGALGPITLSSNFSNGVTFANIVASSTSIADWTCSGVALACVYGQSLDAGATMWVTVRVNVAPSAPSQVRNDAGAGNPQQPAPLSCGVVNSAQCASVTTPVQDATSPHLTLTKTANGSFVRGASGSYTLVVANGGSAATSGVLAITDTLPAGLSYSGFIGSGWSCSATGQVVACTTSAALAAGATNQVTINVAIAASAPSPEINNAVVGSDNDPAPDCSAQQVDGCATTTTPVNDPPLQGQPHLTLTKVANGSFVAGGNASYTLTVSNTGSVSASGPITVTDNLPAGLSFLDARGSDTGWNCTASGQSVSCVTPAALSAGASSSVLLNVAIATTVTGSVTNKASVGTPTVPPPDCTILVDGCAITTTPVVNGPQTAPILALQKSHSGNFRVGAQGIYALTLRNIGTAPTAGALMIEDQLPTGMDFVGATSADPAWQCAGLGNVQCSAVNLVLQPGERTTLFMTVDVNFDALGQVINRADAAGGGLAPVDCIRTPSSPACATDPTEVDTNPSARAATPGVGPFPAPVNSPLALLLLALTLAWLARRRLGRHLS